MDNWENIWGEGENLDALQMSIRAAVSFFILLILIRAGGVRIFGKRSAFDTILMITLGAILARGIIGASPYIPVVAASTTMVIIHRVLGWLSLRNKTIESWVKGRKTILYKNGKIIFKNLARSSLSEEDLRESLRLETRQDSFEKVESACMETNGRISFILKNNNDNGEK